MKDKLLSLPFDDPYAGGAEKGLQKAGVAE